MKGFRLLSASCLSCGLFMATPASAAVKPIERYDFLDVNPDNRFYESIERFIYTDIIDGYVETETYEEDGEVYEDSYVTVRPDEKVTRAQFTKILVNVLSLKEGTKAKVFPDVKQATTMFASQAAKALSRGGPMGNFIRMKTLHATKWRL